MIFILPAMDRSCSRVLRDIKNHVKTVIFGNKMSLGFRWKILDHVIKSLQNFGKLRILILSVDTSSNHLFYAQNRLQAWR